MTHNPVSKRFAALATHWRRDEFFSARLALTGIYTATVGIILGLFSYLLYGALMSGIANSLEGNFATDAAQQAALKQVTGMLQAQLLTLDGIVLIIVVVAGFFLTSLTLRPLKKSRARERRFLADAAHELRTPLTIMKTDTEVLLRDHSSTLADTKELLRKNIDEIDALTRIAYDLLDLMHAENRKNHVAPVAVARVLTAVVQKLTPVARVHDVSLVSFLETGSEGEQVRGAEETLARIFANTIENAIKYSEPGGEVAVSFRRKGNMLGIEIKDSGIGITAEDLPFITEPFYRANSARSRVSGSGLGLAIVKETIETYGGKLHIESIFGKGTTVRILLPRIA